MHTFMSIMMSNHFGFLLATACILVRSINGYSNGVGSCVAGFDKFPVGTEHNWQESTRPGGLLADNYGDVAASGMTITLGETELQRPTGTDQFHYTGECNSTNYLCGMCQGSCSENDHCAEGLECLVREADEDVLGCSGTIGLWDGVGYCYDPAGGRELQGQEAQVEETFQIDTPYTLKLETPADSAFKGFLFRLEGEDGQDLSGALEMVSENMQVLDSTGEMMGDGENVQAMCAPTVSAVCHIEAEDKTMAEAMLTVPQAGKASLEVTVMVGEHEWYLTNYVLQFEGDSSPTEAPPPTEAPAPTEKGTSGTKQTVTSLFATVTIVGLGLVLC